jgi:hypothetical protein
MPLPAPDFERLFAPGARHTLSGGGVATVRLWQEFSLWLPSGRVIAGEPFSFGADDSGFVQRVPPGQYPLVLVLAVSAARGYLRAHEMIAAARLVIRDEPVVSWEMAVHEGQDVAELGDDEFFGYPVDGGTGGFVDAANIAPLCGDDDYHDRLMTVLETGETDFAAGTLTDDEGKPFLVMFSSGGGDGHYPTWVGRTADGEVVCFLTDFFILNDDDDDEPHSGDEDRTPATLPRPADAGPKGLPVKLLPEGGGNLLVRTDFASQQVWDDLCALIGHHVGEGLLTTVRIVDDPVYEGMAAEQLLGLVPDDSDCVYLAVADAQTAAPDGRIQDHTLLIANVDPGDEEHGSMFRALLSEFASIDANLSLANTEFSEYREAVDDDGVYRGGHEFAKNLGATQYRALKRRLEGRPVLTELLPGDTLRLGSLSSRSGTFLLVNQDDGDVVIYRAQDGATVWRTGTLFEDELVGLGLSNRLVLQASGNLVVFAPTGVQVWNSGTQGRDVRRAVLGDDGRLTLVGADGDEVWSSELPHPKPIQRTTSADR